MVPVCPGYFFSLFYIIFLREIQALPQEFIEERESLC